ncbi:hypothetical protein ACFSR9_08955 [Deinococcus taklimakanensis]|uniref:Lipoprotein n=1 Tax=Deinococcus taklimakanensis TaxID=536443 RepID=A0ABW5P3H5_9DEIO
MNLRTLLLGLLAFILAACTMTGTPPLIHQDQAFTPVREARSMWRIRLGHPVTSEVTQTINATAAQVTDAGLEILLDEWGGSKSATWSGLTGGVQDRARVWIDVQDAGAPEGWRTLFSGALAVRPSNLNGKREALGDKYLRLKELPVAQAGGQVTPAPDITVPMGSVLDEAKVDLPHLAYTQGSLTPANVTGSRKFNGESIASALDGLSSLKPGWGWTTRPDDTFYFGPPVDVTATVNAALRGTQVQLRDVISEGMITAVRWVYKLPGGQEVAYESRHPRLPELGRSGITRYIDARSAPAIVAQTPTSYVMHTRDGDVVPSESLRKELQDGKAGGSFGILFALAGETLTATLNGRADWIEWSGGFGEGNPQPSLTLTLAAGATGTQTMGRADDSRMQAFRAEAPAGATATLTFRNGDAVTTGAFTELNPRSLRRDLLDAAAELLYKVPAAHAGNASVPGIQPPAGKITVQRPGLPEFTEKVVGTKYLLRQPMRTEYVIGETDAPTDAQVMQVLIDRRDQDAVNLAVNSGAGT